MLNAIRNKLQQGEKLHKVVFLTAVLAFISLFSAALIKNTAFADTETAFWTYNSINFKGKNHVNNENTSSGDLGLDHIKNLDLPTDNRTFAMIPPEDFNNIKAESIEMSFLVLDDEPSKATSGKYYLYDFNLKTKSVSNKRNETPFKIDPKNYKADVSTCKIKGIGWLICGITESLGEGMDWVYGKIKTFFSLNPIESGSDKILYTFWQTMRNVANIIFAIAILIIVISYITGVGLTNYNIKKMLPKIIVTSILVNISYYLCSIAVDVSNILGYGIEKVFVAIKEQANNISTASPMEFKWSDIVLSILGGAGVGTAASIAVGGALGAVWFIIPLIIVSLFTAVAALFTLAARQALVTIFVMIAPIAFAANILPGTEKLFKKWYDNFFKLLAMFPVFTFVFHGANLAGQIVLQNANGNIIIVLLGMIVQIIPLLIIPALITIGDEYLDRVSDKMNGFVKDKNKQYKGYFDEEREIAKNNWLANKSSSLNFAQKIAQASERTKKLQETRKNSAVQRFQTNLNEDMAKEGTYENEIKLQADKVKLDLANSEIAINKNWAETKAKIAEKYSNAIDANGKIDLAKIGLKGNVKTFEMELAESAFRQNILNSQTNAANSKFNSSYNDLLVKRFQFDGNNYNNASKNIVSASAGILGNKGEMSVVSAALQKQRDETRKEEAAVLEVINEANLEFLEKQQIAEGINTADPSLSYFTKIKDGKTYKFDFNDEVVRNAVIKMQAGSKVMAQTYKLFEEAGEPNGKTRQYGQALSETLLTKGLGEKAFFLSPDLADTYAQGKATENTIRESIFNNIKKGKISAEKLAAQDGGMMDIVTQTLRSMTTAEINKYFSSAEDKKQLINFKTNINKVLHNEELLSKLSGSTKTAYEEMLKVDLLRNI